MFLFTSRFRLACVAGTKRGREGEMGPSLPSPQSSVFLPFPLPPLLTPAMQASFRPFFFFQISLCHTELLLLKCQIILAQAFPLRALQFTRMCKQVSIIQNMVLTTPSRSCTQLNCGGLLKLTETYVTVSQSHLLTAGEIFGDRPEFHIIICQKVANAFVKWYQKGTQHWNPIKLSGK